MLGRGGWKGMKKDGCKKWNVEKVRLFIDEREIQWEMKVELFDTNERKVKRDEKLAIVHCRNASLDFTGI